MSQYVNESPSIQADVDAVNKIPIVASILEVVCRTTGMGFSAIARVTEDKWIACSVRDEIQFGLVPGGELKLETTICNEIRQNGKAVIIDSVIHDATFANHHTPAMYGFQSYISVPIILKNGQFFGTLCAIDPHPAKLNTPQISGMFTLFADLISFHLNAAEQLNSTREQLVEEQKATDVKEQMNKELALANEELNTIQGHLEGVINKLLESEEKLKQAIEVGEMGTWSINPTDYKFFLSDFVRDLFGFQHIEIQVEDVIMAINPEYHQALTNVLKNSIENKQSSSTEFCITNQTTGERKWVHATGKVFTDANGNPAEYSGLLMDITERKLDDLRKNDFIGMVSHELKTPLTTLSAYVQMLQAKAQKSNDAFTGNALDKVSNQVKKMSTMINGFLNVSRLDSGKIILNKQDFPLNELLQEMVDEIKLTAPNYHINLLPSSVLIVNADRDKIGSVISNLLSNAVKYSPKGEVIELQGKAENNSVIVSIRDEGMGIKPEHLDKLFNRFYRVETKHTQHIAGFGIGLYLSAEIINRHGGKIWADSTVGTGSTFYFSLPVEY